MDSEPHGKCNCNVKKQVSKAELAEQLAALIEKAIDTAEEFKAKLPAYLVSAIEHVTSGQMPVAPAVNAAPQNAAAAA